MIHTTIRVYPSGEIKVNGVDSKNLASHINYNINMRPGCAFIVDTFVLYTGVNCKEILNGRIREFIKIKSTMDTAPYC